MFIAGVVRRSALRRRAMCSLKWRQPYCSLETQKDMALLRRADVAADHCYKHCPPNGGPSPPTEGRKEMAKLQ